MSIEERDDVLISTFCFNGFLVVRSLRVELSDFSALSPQVVVVMSSTHLVLVGFESSPLF